MELIQILAIVILTFVIILMIIGSTILYFTVKNDGNDGNNGNSSDNEVDVSFRQLINNDDD